MNDIHLLIVDDEERFLFTYKKLLEKRGITTTTCTNGLDALKILNQRTIDVAVLDVKMPGIDAEQTRVALKKKHKWMEVVELAGHRSTDSGPECAKKAAYFCLRKASELDRFISVLAEACERRVANEGKPGQEHVDRVLGVPDSKSQLMQGGAR